MPSRARADAPAAPAVPALRVGLHKHPDGSAILRCTRADGSVTWQHQRGHQARFFPLHDLTHFAVESTLGARNGFFGLIAQGWDISETGGKGAHGALPAEALYIENLVALVERGGTGRDPLSAAEINTELDALVSHGRLAFRMPLSDELLSATRAAIDALHMRWAAVLDDGALELEFGGAAAD